jgi:hypothetical protein
VRVEREPQLLQVIALDLLLNRAEWTGAELKYLRNACELSQAALAGLLRTRRATVAEREAKPDPRLGGVECIGLRVVLLKAFRDHIGRPGCNHLSPGHRRELASFMMRYCEEALGFMDPAGRRASRRQFTSTPSGRTWELPKAA